MTWYAISYIPYARLDDILKKNRSTQYSCLCNHTEFKQFSRSGMQSSSAAMGWSLEVKQRNNKFGTVGTLFKSTESRTSVFTQPSTMVVMILPQSWQLYPSNPMLYKQNEVVPAFPIVNVYVCPCLNCCDIFGILYKPKVGGSWSKYIRHGTFCDSLVIFPLYPASTEL